MTRSSALAAVKVSLTDVAVCAENTTLALTNEAGAAAGSAVVVKKGKAAGASLSPAAVTVAM